MNIQWTLALRYLSGRKLRTFLTTLAVIFGVVVIFGMNTLIPTMMQSFQATMMNASSNVDLTITHRTSALFTADMLEAVRGVDGVRVAQGRLLRTLNLPADFYDHNPQAADRVSAIALVGLDPKDAQAMRAYEVQPGRFLNDADTAGAGCLITQSLAEILDLQVGDALALPAVTGQVALRVVGIRPLRAAPGGDEVLVTLSTAQAMLDAPGKINLIEADYNSAEPARRAAIQSTIEARLGPDFRFGPLPDSSEVFSTIQMAQVMFNIFGFLALFMGGFIIFNTFRTLVAERRRDLGMLRAVGASRRTITGLILTESLLQGAAGTLLGMLLGYALAGLAMWAVSPTINSLLRMRMGAPVVSPGLVAVTAAIGLGITLLAGLLPALSAGRVTPIEALRPAQAGEENERRGAAAIRASAITGIALAVVSAAALFSGNTPLTTAGALVFLFSLVLVAPALVRPIAAGFGALLARSLAREGTGLLAQGNLTRQPTRAAITASTSMVAMAILVVCGGLMLVITGSFLNAFEKMLSSDYLLLPPAISVWSSNVGASAEVIEQIKAVDGVGVVSTLRYASTTAEVKMALPAKGSPAPANGEGVTLAILGIDPAAYPQAGGMLFTQGKAEEAYQALSGGRVMIINGVFASLSGAKPGDEIPLLTANGRQPYRVVAVATDYLNAKAVTAFISQDNLAADFGVTESVFGQINLRPGADRAKAEAALRALLRDYPQFTLASGQAYYQQMAGMIQTAFSGMYILFAFLAVPSLIAMLNTLAIGVIERTREIGMLRAVGSTQKQVSRMILAEGLLLSALGTVFGMLAGLYLSYAMTGAFRMAGMPVGYVFPWNGLLFAVVVGLLCGALAAVIPARQAARLQIVQALRYE